MVVGIFRSMAKMIDQYREVLAGRMPLPPIAHLVGFKLVRVQEGQVQLEMRCTENMVNSIGAVQGGMIATVADASMGMAAGTMMDENHYVTTIELKINFVRPAKMENITAVGKVINSGKQIIIADCEVMNEAGKLLAKASSTLMVVKNPKGEVRSSP